MSSRPLEQITIIDGASPEIIPEFIQDIEGHAELSPGNRIAQAPEKTWIGRALINKVFEVGRIGHGLIVLAGMPVLPALGVAIQGIQSHPAKRVYGIKGMAHQGADNAGI